MKTRGQRARATPERALYLGIDGGGSRTIARLADAAGRTLGRASAGPSNPITMGLDAAGREILSAARRALAEGGRGELKALCLGVAGGDRPEVARPLETWVRRRIPARFYRVTTDAEIALEAGLEAPGSVLVIAGTGSIACARDERGLFLRAGGWGAAFGDEGSAFDAGRQGVRAALRALDGRGAPTGIGAAIARRLHLQDVREMIGRRPSTAEIAALAPVVAGAARRGDAVARGIIDEAGRELAELTLALIRRLRRDATPVEVICAGGFFRGSGALRASFRRHLRRRAPEARISLLRREPVEGALKLARRAGMK